MDSEGSTIVLIAVLAVVAVLLLIAAKNEAAPKGYQGNTDSNAGFWNSLWNNAANIVDAGGRHTSAFVTSIGNTVSSIIATKQTGKYQPSQYGYSDPKPNYGPYILGTALLVAAVVVLALLIKK